MKVMTEDDSTPAAPSLAGEGGFLPEMIKAVLERGLAAELTGHLGYEVGDPAGRGSPNSLAAYRDATLFKVIYGWGLRRTETSKLDLLDWGRNPAAAAPPWRSEPPTCAWTHGTPSCLRPCAVGWSRRLPGNGKPGNHHRPSRPPCCDWLHGRPDARAWTETCSTR